MGTDIHSVFQKYDSAASRWHDVTSTYDEGRHYQLFSVLAGVRNGYGFAGGITGEPVNPISEPRGLPSDFEMDDDSHPVEGLEFFSEWRRKCHETEDPLAIWMGDHSYSWLLGNEMLDWYEKAPTVIKTGYIRKEIYFEWDKVSKPSSSCGDISGPGVVKIEEPEVGKSNLEWTHVRVTWESSLFDELSYFFGEVQKLVELHGRIRFVFGFDS